MKRQRRGCVGRIHRSVTDGGQHRRASNTRHVKYIILVREMRRGHGMVVNICRACAVRCIVCYCKEAGYCVAIRHIRAPSFAFASVP